MNKKGFTLIEVTVSIVIVSLILVSLLGSLVKLREIYTSSEENSEVLIYASSVSRIINKDIIKNNGIRDIVCNDLKDECELTLANEEKRKIEILTVNDETNEEKLKHEEIKTTLKYTNITKEEKLLYMKTLKLDRYTNLKTNEITANGYNFLNIESKKNEYEGENEKIDIITELKIKIYDGEDINDKNYDIGLYGTTRYNYNNIIGKTYKIEFDDKDADKIGSRGIEEEYGVGYYKYGSTHGKEDRIDKIEIPEKEGKIFGGYYYKDGVHEEVLVVDTEGKIVANNRLFTSNITKNQEYPKVEALWEECEGKYQLVDGKCQLKPKYVDSELHGADPVLGSGMIPVMLDNTGKATYAHDYDEWYSYKNKKWANAVILVDSPSNPNYEAGDIIQESDIRGYFVWIPKYKYKLFNMGNYNGVESNQTEIKHDEIDIVFGTGNTGEASGECKTPMESGLSKASDATKECQKDNYMTHPAFLSIPSNGFWVGKFEIGYDGATSSADTEITEEYKNGLENKIIVKPNVYSWRNQTIETFFETLYNFNRSLDSHMMKNTEWGAVSYLSYSQYGIMDEVRLNNHNDYKTGYAASEPNGATASDVTKTFSWNTETGYLASTTGNISGIYDMSGGVNEYVATYIENIANKMTSIVNDLKYLDKYASDITLTSYNKRILGDATGELGPFYLVSNDVNNSLWYDDYGVFASFNKYPYFVRGGAYANTTSAGIMAFYRENGNSYVYTSSRLILTPKISFQ